MKLMLMGYGGHGKGTVADMLPLTYMSSSLFITEQAILPILGNKYNYQTVEECYSDRRSHRKEWCDLIKAYNTPDKTRLAKKLYSIYDIYEGIRSRDEFEAIKEAGLYDHSVWVDASKRLLPEDISSNELTMQDAEFVIDNNGEQNNLNQQIENLKSLIGI